MTDVPRAAPSEFYGGGDLAMLEQPQAAKTPPQEDKAKEPAWKPGQPFETNITLGDQDIRVRIEDFDTRPMPNGVMRPAKVTIFSGPEDKKGKERIIAPTSPAFAAIQSAYESKLPKPEEVDPNYPLRVNVDGTPIKARYDDKLGRIVYADPLLGDTVYNKSVLGLEEGEVTGPMDEYGQERKDEITRIQESYRRPVAERTQRLLETKGGYTRLDPGLVNRIRPKWSDPSPGDPMGGLSFTYMTDTGEELSLEDAQKRGLVPPTVANKLQERYKSSKSAIDDYRKAISAQQSLEAESQDDRELRLAQEGITFFEQKLQELPSQNISQTEYRKQERDYQDRIAKLNRKIDDIRSRAGGAQMLQGQVLATAQPPDAVGFSIDPETRTGALTLFAGGQGTPLPGMPVNEVTPTTEDQWAQNIINQVASDVQDQTVNVMDDDNYKIATDALAKRLNRIEDQAVEASEDSGKAPVEYFEDPNTTFTFKDENGVTRRMKKSINSALDEMNDAAQKFKEAVATGDSVKTAEAKERFAQVAMPFSGTISVPGLSMPFPPLKENVVMGSGQTKSVTPESTFAYLRDAFAGPTFLKYQRSEDMRVSPTTRKAEAPKVDVTRTATGNTKNPTVPRYPAYPIFKDIHDGKVVKLDTGFSIFDRLFRPGGGEAQYDKVGALYSTGQSAKTFGDQMGRAMMRDQGISLEQPEIRAVNKSIKDFNESVLPFNSSGAFDANQGKDIRTTAVRLLYQIAKQSGLPIHDGASWYEAELEGMLAKVAAGRLAEAQVQANKILDRLYEVNTRGVSKLAEFNTTIPGSQAASGSVSNPTIYGPSAQPALWKNVLQMWQDMVNLYMAAGQKKTQYGYGTQTVTWMYNPADPAQSLYTSVLTIPSGIMYDTDNVVPIKFDKQDETNANPSAIGSTQNRPMDPAFSQAIVSLNNIAGIYGPLRNGLERAADEIVNRAKSSYNAFTSRGPGGNISLRAMTGDRPAQDEETYWDSSSNTVVAKNAADTIFVSNYFGKNRTRKGRRASYDASKAGSYAP
jgi:hypothetical protein